MRSLLTVAFPEVSEHDAAFMRAFRLANCPAASVEVAPHFTLAFGCSSIPESDYLSHISAVASQNKPVHFVCRYAMLGADDEDNRAYVFLVPDEGFSGVSLLHDRVYTGPLSPYLRLDLPYTPHITIGIGTDRGLTKALCDELNAKRICISGTIRELSVGTVQEGRFQVVEALRLDA